MSFTRIVTVFFGDKLKRASSFRPNWHAHHNHARCDNRFVCKDTKHVLARISEILIALFSVADPGFGRGELTPGRGRKPIIWPIFTENCMKMKNFWAGAGARRVPRAP